MPTTSRSTTPSQIPFDLFRAAKSELRAAEVACRQAWLDSRGGDALSHRRYRAALLRQERAVGALRHLTMQALPASRGRPMSNAEAVLSVPIARHPETDHD